MADDAKDDAMRLLQEMAVRSGGRAGVTVHPSEVAPQVGLVPDTPRCDAALSWLESEGAIEPDEEDSAYTYAGATDQFYKVKRRGLDMARTKQGED